MAAATSSRREAIVAPASPEEAAAIAAAIERFMRATAPSASPHTEALDGWRREALVEGTSREPGGYLRDPWINT